MSLFLDIVLQSVTEQTAGGHVPQVMNGNDTACEVLCETTHINPLSLGPRFHEALVSKCSPGRSRAAGVTSNFCSLQAVYIFMGTTNNMQYPRVTEQGIGKPL